MTGELKVAGFDRVEIYEQASSTMDLARAAIPTLEGGAVAIAALSQSAGRGRQGRSWNSSAGALMATFIFKTPQPVAALSGYSLVVGIALVDAFARFGANLRLKWPNDLVIVRDGAMRKVGGVLIEVEDLGDSRAILVGVGVNLTCTPSEVPHATSIEEISGRVISVEEALVSVCSHLREAHLLFVARSGFEYFKERWEGLTCFISGESEISIDCGAKTVRGRYVGLDRNGSLLLNVAGVVSAFNSGHLSVD